MQELHKSSKLAEIIKREDKMPKTQEQKTNNALEELLADLGDTKPNVVTCEELEEFIEKNLRVLKPVGVVVYVQNPKTLELVEVDYEPLDPDRARDDADYKLQIVETLRAGVLAELPKSRGTGGVSRLPRKGRGPIAENPNIAYAYIES